MEIILVSKGNKQDREIPAYQLEEEVRKVMPTSYIDFDEVLEKLRRGDLLGFNGVHFKIKR